MSTVKSKNLQIGTDGTASNNFTIYQPGTPDGTLRVGNGNAGAATDVVTVNSSGNVGIGTSSPSYDLQLGNNSSTSTSTPKTISLGGTYNSTAGTNPKLRVWTDSVNDIGFGVSANQLDYITTDPNHSHVWYTNSTERMRIDGSGRVTTPYQPHILGVPTNTSGSGNANSFTILTSQGGLAFVTDRITVPVAGVYLITFNTICDQTTGRVDTRIYINGAEKFSTLSEDNGTGYHYRGVSNAIVLQANDYIQFGNDDWYDAPNTGVMQWRSASVTLIG